MSEETSYQRNIEIILDRAKECYENDKERLREEATNKYRELSEEEKKIKSKNIIVNLINLKSYAFIDLIVYALVMYY